MPRLVVLPDLVPCEPYSARLTERACVLRYRIANMRIRGAGVAAIASADLRSTRCAGCTVGKGRLAGQSRLAPDPGRSTIGAEAEPSSSDDDGAAYGVTITAASTLAPVALASATRSGWLPAS